MIQFVRLVELQLRVMRIKMIVWWWCCMYNHAYMSRLGLIRIYICLYQLDLWGRIYDNGIEWVESFHMFNPRLWSCVLLWVELTLIDGDLRMVRIPCNCNSGLFLRCDFWSSVFMFPVDWNIFESYIYALSNKTEFWKVNVNIKCLIVFSLNA